MIVDCPACGQRNNAGNIGWGSLIHCTGCGTPLRVGGKPERIVNPSPPPQPQQVVVKVKQKSSLLSQLFGLVFLLCLLSCVGICTLVGKTATEVVKHPPNFDTGTEAGAGAERAERQAARDEPVSDITWSEYSSACGVKAQQQNQARTERTFKTLYKGKVVRWTGTIQSIQSEIIGSGNVVRLRMNPTESPLGKDGSDVSLSMPANVDVMSLDKGRSITFVGKIKLQGGTFTDHQLDYLRQ